MNHRHFTAASLSRSLSRAWHRAHAARSRQGRKICERPKRNPETNQPLRHERFRRLGLHRSGPPDPPCQLAPEDRTGPRLAARRNPTIRGGYATTNDDDARKSRRERTGLDRAGFRTTTIFYFFRLGVCQQAVAINAAPPNRRDTGGGKTLPRSPTASPLWPCPRTPREGRPDGRSVPAPTRPPGSTQSSRTSPFVLLLCVCMHVVPRRFSRGVGDFGQEEEPETFPTEGGTDQGDSSYRTIIIY
jgi:hypothetical protein